MIFWFDNTIFVKLFLSRYSYNEETCAYDDEVKEAASNANWAKQIWSFTLDVCTGYKMTL